MLKPYVGATVHYIPMSDEELRCKSCDQPRAAMITRVHNDLDVDLVVFTSKENWPAHVRTVVSYALMSDKAPHWRWIDTTVFETVQDPETKYSTSPSHAASVLMSDAPDDLKNAVRIMHHAPLQDALRALAPGRGDRDRLLLERWALALEGHLVDTSVEFVVDKEGKMRVGVTTEEGTVLEDDSHVTRSGEQA